MLLGITMYGSIFTVNGIKYGTEPEDNKGGYYPTGFEEGKDAIVVGLENTSYSGKVIIPESVNYNEKTLIVKFIGANAFNGCVGITSISMGSKIEYIEWGAFGGCTNLVSFNLPSSVEYIGEDAFNNTAWYNNLPDGLIYKDNVLLGYKGGQPEGNLEVQEGTRVIASSAFAYCRRITSVKYPSSLITIGQSSFFQSGLTSVTIPRSVKLIDSQAFHLCRDLIKMEVEDGNTTYDSRNNCNAIIKTTTNTLISGCQNTIIPNTVTSIASLAFRGQYNLESIVIPNSVTSIGGGAFSNCGLKNVYSQIKEPYAIDGKAEGDYVQAFTYNDDMTLYVPMGTKGKYQTTDGWKDFKNIVEMEPEPDYEIEIKSDLTAVIKKMKVDETGIIEIPGKVEKDGKEYTIIGIATEAFKDNTDLKEVIIPNTVTSIGVSAFQGCTNLTSVVIGNSVSNIFRYAFKGCQKLASFNIPNSVTFVGWNAFEKTVWYNNQPGGLLYKDNVLLGYKGEEPMGTLNIANGTRVIAEYAFRYCFDINSIIFPNTVTSICKGAFFETGITTVTLPSSLTNLELQAFDGTELETVYSNIAEPFEIEGANYGPFGMRYEHAILYVPAGTKALYEATAGWKEFKNIVEMEPEPYEIKEDQTVVVKELEPDETGKVEIPEKVEIDGMEYTVTEIAEAAFKDNTELTEVTIPSTVTTIGAGAFEGCTNLKAIYVLSLTPASMTPAASRSEQRKATGKAASQFEGIDFETCVLYVPFGSEEAYREAEGWKEFKHIVGVHGETDPALTVKAKSYTREYGEENPAFEFTTEGAALDGEPMIECEATTESAVGTYDIIVKKGSVKNYNDTYVKGTLTITKAPLKVSVKDVEREQGEENPQFELVYEGWKLQDTESVLLKKPVATTTATKDSKPGTYPITISGGEARNYELRYVNGRLTVTIPSSINELTESETFDVYDMSGRKVRRQATTLKDLPKGVYVVNGRKLVAK